MAAASLIGSLLVRRPTKPTAKCNSLGDIENVGQYGHLRTMKMRVIKGLS
jgi:hypothetical protein